MVVLHEDYTHELPVFGTAHRAVRDTAAACGIAASAAAEAGLRPKSVIFVLGAVSASARPPLSWGTPVTLKPKLRPPSPRGTAVSALVPVLPSARPPP